MTEKEYRKLKAAMEKHAREAGEAAGGVKAIMAEIKDKFGCDKLVDAERLLARERAALAREEAKLEEAKDEFIEKYGGPMGLGE